MKPISRKIVLVAAAGCMAVAGILVPARETWAQEKRAPGAAAQETQAPDADSRGKKLALIRLLVRAGRSDEAATAMRSLYPKGPPYGGELALEYYDVIGNTQSGWEEAKDGLEKLVKAAPDDTSYQLMLAKHLARRADTRRHSLKLFAALALNPGADRGRVLEEWRNALDKLDYSAASIPFYKEYLEVDPDNSSVRDALAGAQRVEAAKLPWQLRDKADAKLAAGHPEEALAILKHALLLDPKNAWVRFDLSRLYHKRGDVKHGRELMEGGLTAAPGDADMLYANALYVGLLDEADNALRLLDRIPPRERSPGVKQLRRKMDIKLQTQHAQALARDGHPGQMQAAMRHAEGDAGKDAELLNIVANAWIDLGEPARGVALLKPLAAQPSATVDARMYYAKLLNRAEQYDELAAVLANLSAAKGLSASDREDLRYLRASLAAHRADSLRHQGKTDEARALLLPALKQDPENSDMLMALARVHVATGEGPQARAIYQEILQRTPGDAGARQALNKMASVETDDPPQQDVGVQMPEPRHKRGGGYAGGGVDYVSKTGSTPGISNLSVLELPVEMHVPVDGASGLAFVQVDPVVADAGVLDLTDLYNLRQYGKVLALAPNGLASANPQKAKGSAMAFGYEQDGFRADIGTTPIGFPVSDMVGGLKWSNYTDVSGFSLDVSRRPMTSSLLAYAGARDPVTSETWGGVRSSGVSMHLSHDIGRLSGFFEPGYFALTGKNVLSNTEAALRTGFNWSFVDTDDMRLTAGAAITYWHYRENLRFYSFGHGGYYSPQKYYSLSLPVRWAGREENWSYLLQASVSAAVSHEKDMPFYPTDPALQAQAVANTSLSTATYTGGPGHSTGYSIGGAIEYRLTPRLFGGGRLQIDRSLYYTPNFAIFYLRYMFDGQSGPVPYPPEPIRAYSRY